MAKIEKLLYNNLGKKNKETRDRWLERTLSVLPSGIDLLDAGAGEQQYRKFCTHVKYVSQDFALYTGAGDNLGLQTGEWDYKNLDIISDIVSIPVPDCSFDVILCTEVFEHIPEPIKAIREFSRILKPGGKLILTLPVCSLTHFAPYYFYNGFSRYFLIKYLEESDMSIFELNYNGNYYEFLAQEIHRIPYMAERYSGFKGPFFKYFLKGLLVPLMIFLNFLSKRDTGSTDLLSMGIHVVAIKKEIK
jgi:SAM-dependent methyltransferase